MVKGRGIHLLLVLCIGFGLFSFTTSESFAAKKSYKKASYKYSKKKKRRSHSRACNTILGKQQALDILRTGSTPEIQVLAGLSSASEFSSALEQVDERVQQQLMQEVEEVAELANGDDSQVDIEAYKMMWLSFVDPQGEAEQQSKLMCGANKQSVMTSIMDWLGTRYHFGGTGRRGIDCSAFVREVYSSAAGIMLPRTAQSQIEVGRNVESVGELKFGDLVFFHTRNHAYVSHVGIYLGNNLFAHSSTRFGVTVSSLDSDYYSSHLIGARRLTEQDVLALGANTEATEFTQR